MKKVALRRKELMNHLPKEVRLSAKTKLGSIYVGRQPLRGVEGKEEEEMLTGILDVGPAHADWHKHIKFHINQRKSVSDHFNPCNINSNLFRIIKRTHRTRNTKRAAPASSRNIE